MFSLPEEAEIELRMRARTWAVQRFSQEEFENRMKFDDAGLVCGGVKTANATVYMVDGVMMPSK